MSTWSRHCSVALGTSSCVARFEHSETRPRQRPRDAVSLGLVAHDLMLSTAPASFPSHWGAHQTPGATSCPVGDEQCVAGCASPRVARRAVVERFWRLGNGTRLTVPRQFAESPSAPLGWINTRDPLAARQPHPRRSRRRGCIKWLVALNHNCLLKTRGVEMTWTVRQIARQ
jgi:hypothetical protein